MGAPSLFAFRGSPASGGTAGVQTPLGHVAYDLTADGVVLTSAAPQVFRAGEAELLVWDGQLARLELLSVTPRAGTHGAERVRARAAMFRLAAHRPIGSLVARARLQAGQGVGSAMPETGECLTAVRWQRAGEQLSVGTQDFPALCAYNAPLPRAWRVADPERHAIERFAADGLSIDLPPLAAGERAQVHFVAAWGPVEGPGDVSTWLAVEVDPAGILAGLG